MKLKRLLPYALSGIGLAAGTVLPATATKIEFWGLKDNYYLIRNSTNERIDFEDMRYGACVLDLSPETYTIWGIHPNDKSNTYISAEFTVKPEDGLELKDDEEFGQYHYGIGIGIGYYYLSQSYKNADGKSVSMRGGTDFTVENVRMVDEDGNPVKSTYAERITDKDTAASGYYCIGLTTYTSKATFKPLPDVHPDYIATDWSKQLTSSSNASTVKLYEGVTMFLTYPENATGDLYYKSGAHFVPFDLVEPTSQSTEDGIVTKNYLVSKDSKSYSYRVSREGSITCAGIFSAKDDTPGANVTEEMLTADGPDYFNHDVSAKSGNGTRYADIFLNINKRHLLRLKKDQQFQIVNMRTWQLTNNSTDNYFIEPDFHWTVLNTNFEPDESVVKVDGNGMLTPVASGTAIVQVDYDAIRLSAMGGNLWSELWAENMGTFVVMVDSDAEKAPDDNIRLAYKPDATLDAEHDILYYMSDQPGFELTFTPDEGAAVSVANPLVDREKNTVTYPDGFSDKNVSVNEDGSVTALLTYGRNIIRTTGADGETNYQVLSAKPITCEVVAPRADGLIIPGDDVTFNFDGLFHVSGKLAGIYNCNCHVRFDGESTFAGTFLGGGQYDFAGNQSAQSFTKTVPVDASDKVVISEGCLQPEGYGSGGGAHRTVEYKDGTNPNFGAESHSAEYGFIPSQWTKVTPFNEIDRLSIKTKMGKSFLAVRPEVLREVYGENIHWEIEDETIAIVNDTWRFCPAKPGTTAAHLYADETALDSDGERVPLLTCDIEIEDVEGYVPVTSMKFRHEGDWEVEMNLSWGNWGNATGCRVYVDIEPENATDKTIHFTSGDTEYLTVGTKGNAECNATSASLFWNLQNLPGEAVLTAETADGRLKDQTVVRFLRYADKIELDVDTVEILIGDTHKLNASVTPNYCSYPVRWESDNEDVATVDDEGNITPVSEGSAKLSAKVKGYWNDLTAPCLVTVKKVMAGIGEIENEIVSIYPNPCLETLNVVAAVDGEVCIFGLDGSLVLKTVVGQGRNSVDVSGLNAGLYIVRLGNATTKLIKE